MFENKILVDIDFLLHIQLYWGWENGGGKLSLELLDVSMLKDWNDIFILQIHAWVIGLSVSANFEWVSGLTQRAADGAVCDLDHDMLALEGHSTCQNCGAIPPRR